MTAATDPSKPSQPTPTAPRTWPRKAIAAVALAAAVGTLWIKGVVMDDTPRPASASSVPAPRVEPVRDASDSNHATTRSTQQEEWSNKPVVAMRRNLFLIPTAFAAADPASRPMVRQAPPPPAPVAVAPQPLPSPQPLAATPTTQPSAQETPQPQVIVVMSPGAQAQASGNSIQHGLSRNSRVQLGQSAYQDALDELSATDPDLNTAIWHLDSALNFNPDFTEAIVLREKINAQLVSRSSGAVIDAFLRRQMLASQTTRPSGGQQ
jgi:hypothetical protein